MAVACLKNRAHKIRVENDKCICVHLWMRRRLLFRLGCSIVLHSCMACCASINVLYRICAISALPHTLIPMFLFLFHTVENDSLSLRFTIKTLHIERMLIAWPRIAHHLWTNVHFLMHFTWTEKMIDYRYLVRMILKCYSLFYDWHFKRRLTLWNILVCDDFFLHILAEMIISRWVDFGTDFCSLLTIYRYGCLFVLRGCFINCNVLWIDE